MMHKFWFILAATLLFTGCVGTDVGNPQSDPDGDELLIGTDPELETSAQGLTYQGVEIESAWIVVDSIELKEDCDSGQPVSTSGPFVVDLLAPAETPIPLPAESLESSCQLRINFAPTKESDVPGSLSGHWLSVEGTLSDGSPVTISATRSERLQFVGRSAPINLDRARGVGLLANLSLVNWISENLDGAGEAVTVSDDSTGPLPNDLRLQIKTRSRLYRDADKNGVVDRDNPAPVALPEFD